MSKTACRFSGIISEFINIKVNKTASLASLETTRDLLLIKDYVHSKPAKYVKT